MRLETERLVIRSAVRSDAPSLQRLFSDPDVRRWLPAGEPWTLERAQQSIEARIAGERERGYAAWIVERKDGEFIGSCALQLVERKGPEVEIAYHYVPSAWGKGYGTEVAIAVLGYGFRTIGLERIIALAYQQNVGSWRIMEKAGNAIRRGRHVLRDRGTEKVRRRPRRMGEMMAKLDAIGIVCADIAKSIRFYRLLGLEFPNETEDHIEAVASNGMRVMLDKLELIKRIDPDWVTPVGRRMSLAFGCASPRDVDATFARVVQAGFQSKDAAPYDAFWGQRYATLFDPDGNGVDLFAELPKT